MTPSISKKKLASMLDHTNLKAYAVHTDFDRLCQEAREMGAAMVAINTEWVSYCKELLWDTPVHVGAAISFPLGQSGLETKLAETRNAIAQGSDEIDYVIHIGKAKEKDWDYLAKEMLEITAICREKGIISKVIFENCYLTPDEIKALAAIASVIEPDFIKTSTGFGTGGATVEDVRLMKKTVKGKVQVKAAGGIRSLKDALAMIEAGASRLGTSASIRILDEYDQLEEVDSSTGQEIA